MNSIGLRSIKWESIRQIFRVIAENDVVTRADISDETGLSLMTVGKVADALLSLNVVTQDKEKRNSAGRRAGLLRIQQANYALILDLTSRNFSVTAIDMRLNIINKNHFAYDENLSYSENLDLFLQEVMRQRTLQAERHCIGIGVSVPGVYNSEKDRVISSRIAELEDIPIARRVTDVLHEPNLVIEASYHAAARSQISRIENFNEKIILYWFVGEGNIYGTVVYNGTIMQGAHLQAGDFGNMVVNQKSAEGNICTLEKAICAANTPEKNAFELAKAIRNVMRVVDPDLILLECELYKHTETGQEPFIEMVRNTLTEDFNIAGDTIPELIAGHCKFRHAHRGLTMKLRENWLSAMIMTTKGDF